MSFLKRPKTLGIILTYACTSNCKNCGSFSHPYETNKLNINLLEKILKEAKELNFYNIVLTGGEPTYSLDNLFFCLNKIKEYNFPVRIVTNAHWARTIEDSKYLLKKMKENGITEINYSTGDEHTKFVPLENIINAIIASIELEIKTLVMIETRENAIVNKELIFNSNLISNLPSSLKEHLFIIESPWVELNPKFIEKSKNTFVKFSKNNVATCTGCENILQTFLIDPDGKIGVCCGLGIRMIPELSMGSLYNNDSLEDIINNAESDFLKLWIRYYGPEKILSFISNFDRTIKWENMYSHKCQACIRIFKDKKIHKVIRENYHKFINDVIIRLILEENLFNKFSLELTNEINEKVNNKNIHKITEAFFQYKNIHSAQTNINN